MREKQQLQSGQKKSYDERDGWLRRSEGINGEKWWGRVRDEGGRSMVDRGGEARS
jgi:hypothetical protein